MLFSLEDAGQGISADKNDDELSSADPQGLAVEDTSVTFHICN